LHASYSEARAKNTIRRQLTERFNKLLVFDLAEYDKITRPALIIICGGRASSHQWGRQ
jgi:hypothetical protein